MFIQVRTTLSSGLPVEPETFPSVCSRRPGAVPRWP